MSAGIEFETDGAATEKARRASSVRVRGTASSGTSDRALPLKWLILIPSCSLFITH